jgi:uncharacterized membrane protein YgcG
VSEWLSYRPEDFLLFSEPVYWRLFALHNEALWPAPVLAVAASAILLYAALRPSTTGGRIAGTLLALAWLSAGVLFLGQRYASINWAASYVAPSFVFQALLVAAVAWRGGLASGGGGAGGGGGGGGRGGGGGVAGSCLGGVAQRARPRSS